MTPFEIASGTQFVTGNSYPSLLGGNTTQYRMLANPKGKYLLASRSVVLPAGVYHVTTELFTDPNLLVPAPSEISPGPFVRVTYDNKNPGSGPAGGEDVEQSFNSFGHFVTSNGIDPVTLDGILDVLNDYLAAIDVRRIEFTGGGLDQVDYTILKSNASDAQARSNIAALIVVFSKWYGRTTLSKVE